MISVDIISGIQGSGKSTLILRLLHTVYADEAAALIENEQGKVRLSLQAVRDARGSAVSRPDVFVTEIPTGCICCSRSDMLEQAITDIARRETFNRILLEPAGTAKLADLSDWNRTAPITAPLAAHTIPLLSRYNAAGNSRTKKGPTFEMDPS